MWANLHAWGSSKTKPKTEEIKRLHQKLEVLNAKEMTKDGISEFLEVSKQLDDLLLKKNFLASKVLGVMVKVWG